MNKVIVKKALSLLLVTLMILSYVSGAFSIKSNAADSTEIKSGKWKYKTVTVVKDGKNVKEKRKYSYKFNDGTKPYGIYKVKDGVYLFDGNGVLQYSNTKYRFVKSRGRYFYVGKNAKAISGWHIYKNKLYYFSPKTFEAVRNKSVDGIVLGTDGAAEPTLDVTLKIQCKQILDKICSPNDSQSMKLTRIWNFMVSRSNFSYGLKYPNMSTDNWGKKLASDMLATRVGNCYGFACAFAALANEAGYDAYLVTGRIHGNRDRAADGFTRHGFVRIGGLYYDPEIKWAGTSHIYAMPGCPFVMKSRVDYRFANFNGKRLMNESSTTVAKNKIVKQGGYYHYYDKKGKEIFGTYFIDGQIYNFVPGYGMSEKMKKYYKSLGKEGASYKSLKKKIGDSKKRTSQSSCYEDNATDYVNTYKNIVVYTVKSNSGGTERIVAITSR